MSHNLLKGIFAATIAATINVLCQLSITSISANFTDRLKERDELLLTLR